MTDHHPHRYPRRDLLGAALIAPLGLTLTQAMGLQRQLKATGAR